MSLPSSHDYLFRTDPLHLSSTDDCNIFDQVFDHKLYEVHDGEDDDASKDSPNEQDYFATEATVDDYPRLPSLCGSTSLETSTKQPSPQPWRQGLWCLNQNTLNVEKTRKTGVGTISGAQLFNDQELLTKSHSPSASPTRISTKRFITSPNAVKYLHKANSHLPLSREATLSPSPLYAQLPLQAKMQQVETWQQDFQNFTLHNPRLRSDESLAMNLPREQKTRITQFNNLTMANNAAHQSRGLPVGSLYHEGSAEKAIDPGLIHRDSNDLMVQTQLPQSSQSAQPNSFDQGFGLNWTTDSLDSSNGSHQSCYDTLPPSLSSGISSNGIQNVMMTQNQIWWPQDMTPATPAWSPNPKESSTGIAAPTPKRAATHSYAENMTDRTEGLGIHFPDFNGGELHDHPSFFDGIEPKTPTTILYSPKRTKPMSHGIPPVPPLPFATPYQGIFDNGSPFSTPYTIRQSPIRPNSPPLSPLNTNTRSSRRHNRSPSRPENGTHHNHHRRKSIHKPGPIKSTGNLIIDDPLPSTTSTTSSTTARARSRSQSKPPRTPRTPKTPSSAHFAATSTNPHHSLSKNGNGNGHGNGFNSIDFVNFTARDSVKLLSDVAPSGSSKTRARRDAEARDKRKKLSEAALRAVSSAGGDVEALRRAISA